MKKLLIIAFCGIMSSFFIMPIDASEKGTTIEKGVNTEIQEPPALSQENTMNIASQANSGDVALDQTNFPDVILLNEAKTYDTDRNQVLSKDECSKVLKMRFHNTAISDLTGIEYFENLTDLEIHLSFLTNFDISKNVNLEILDISYNKLTNLDISKNVNLKRLDISNNQLTALDTSSNTKLISIAFNNNKGLTTLDFRKNKELESAYHAVGGEIILISSGMLNYIGCHLNPSHTGNIIIDLENSTTTLPNGDHQIDLSTVISTVLLKQITENSNLYNPTTKILTIPAGNNSVIINARNKNKYTFYIDYDNVVEEKPEKPDFPETSSPKNEKAPITRDTTNLDFYYTLICISAGTLIVFLKKLPQKKVKN